jgi:hypothetical protein
MLADRWVCSVARLQRLCTVGEGPQHFKIVGKVLYQLKDIEAQRAGEEATRPAATDSGTQRLEAARSLPALRKMARRYTPLPVVQPKHSSRSSFTARLR